MRKPLKRKAFEAIPTVPVEKLKDGLPAFWPSRENIWDLPEETRPIDVVVYATMRELGAAVFHPSFFELENAYRSISDMHPEEGGAIFKRLWWLATFLNGSPLDQVSDMLVTMGQTSKDWDDICAAAATVAGTDDDAVIDRDRMYAAVPSTEADLSASK